MDAQVNRLSPCLSKLIELVNQELKKVADAESPAQPDYSQEIDGLEASIHALSKSLAKIDLPDQLRALLESECNTALTRKTELLALNCERIQMATRAERLLQPSAVLDRLDRLQEVLAANNPTLSNLELSQFIDRIDCFDDGRVMVRTCKLGLLPDVTELLRSDDVPNSMGPEAAVPRRRSRLRTAGGIENGADLVAMAEFAADSNRFSGLHDNWFWNDAYQIPSAPLSWKAANAEAIFTRRVKDRLSCKKLATEFGATASTIAAAIRHYLESHPGVMDIKLERGGKRGKKIDIEKFADEARELWESGWSKERLAVKFGHSATVIHKALKLSYLRSGEPMPTHQDSRVFARAKARRLLDQGHSLEKIAKEMNKSDITTRLLLKESFAAEGKIMPDLRRRASA